MTDPTLPMGANSVTPQSALPSTESTKDGGAAFKALLEKLEGKARETREPQAVAGPQELAGAADRAKASISDALLLRDQLLEAYRASQQSGQAGQ